LLPSIPYERVLARADDATPPLSSFNRLIRVSLTVLKVPAASSACSLIWSAIWTSRSKLALLRSLLRRSSTSFGKSSATRSTSFNEAIPCSPFPRGLPRLDPRCPFPHVTAGRRRSALG